MFWALLRIFLGVKWHVGKHRKLCGPNNEGCMHVMKLDSIFIFLNRDKIILVTVLNRIPYGSKKGMKICVSQCNRANENFKKILKITKNKC